jgi:acylphosphatase
MILHHNLTIRGRVQGVGFRYMAFKKAQSLGLKGYITNRQNGDVFCEVEGDIKSIETFIAWCHQGPPLAKVSAVIVEKMPAQGFTEFTIEKNQVA